MSRPKIILKPVDINLTTAVVRTNKRMINIIGNVIGTITAETAAALASIFATRVEEDGGIVESQDCLTDRIQNLKTLGLWDKASAVWLPHGYKEGKLYAVKGGSGADLSFIRAGTRTRKGPTYVEQVPYNLLSYSNRLNTSPWAKLGVPNVTVTENAGVAPDNTNTASLIINNDTASGKGVRGTSQTGIIPNGEIFTLTFWAKLSVGSFSIEADISDDNVTVIPLTNEWVKYTITGAVSASSLFADITFSTGAVQNNAFYVWGVQLVLGSTSIDYFKTTDRFNVPALDYTNDTCPSLSLEPARTNLLLQSEVFGTTWATDGVTVSSNSVAAPNGLVVADSLLETAISGLHGITQSITKAGSSIQYTYTAYLKGIGRSWAVLEAYNGVNGLIQYFNISTGAVGSLSPSGAGFALTNAKITPFANGFYRCEMSFTTDATTALTLTIRAASADNVRSFLGDITKGVAAYGAQLEAGPYATSYIPTTTATVSRIDDTIPGLTGVSSLIGQTEGTIYWSGYTFADGGGKRIAFTWEGGASATSDRILLDFSATNRIRVVVTTNNTTQVDISNAGFSSNTLYKVVVTYQNNKVALFVNGVKIEEDLSVTVPPNMDRIGFDQGVNGSIPFYGYTENLSILKTALTDAEAIALTTP